LVHPNIYYQKGEYDRFIHKYEYDAENRITDVYTSTDDLIWSNDVKYFYYLHGPLGLSWVSIRYRVLIMLTLCRDGLKV
jgi:hypothetical protein